MTWTSLVTKIWPRSWDAEASSGPQNTGILAQMQAEAVSRAAMTKLMGPYHVGSNVGYVVALCSTVVANRQTEKMLTLMQVSTCGSSKTKTGFLHCAHYDDANKAQPGPFRRPGIKVQRDRQPHDNEIQDHVRRSVGLVRGHKLPDVLGAVSVAL